MAETFLGLGGMVVKERGAGMSADLAFFRARGRSWICSRCTLAASLSSATAPHDTGLVTCRSLVQPTQPEARSVSPQKSVMNSSAQAPLARAMLYFSGSAPVSSTSSATSRSLRWVSLALGP
jgi:hypothetical protein